MRFSGVILALLASSGKPDISIFDSKTKPGQSWILVDDCAVEVKTSDIKAYPDKIIKQINDLCGLDYVNEEK